MSTTHDHVEHAEHSHHAAHAGGFVARVERSHEVHARSDRFDLAELGVEIGLVLCSIAMLAKRKAFWILAVLFALAGGGCAYTGYAGIGLGHAPAANAPVEASHH